MGSREWCYGSCSFCPAHSKVRDFPPQACQVHCPPPPTPQAVFPPLFFFLFFPLLPTTVASNPPSGCGRVRQVTSPQLHRHVVPARLVPPFSNCHVAGNQVNSLFHLKKEKERKNERKSKRARGADREGSPPKIYSSYVHYFCCSPPPFKSIQIPPLGVMPSRRPDRSLKGHGEFGRRFGNIHAVHQIGATLPLLSTSNGLCHQGMFC